MKKISFFVATGILASLAIVSSCKKDDSTSKTTLNTDDVSNVQDNSVAMTTFDDIDAEVEDATIPTGLKSSLDDSTNRPTKKIIRREKGKTVREFHYNGKMRNGKIESGKIIVTTTYPTSADSTQPTTWVKTITLDGYTRNGRKVEGTKTITYLGKVDGTHPRWEVKLVGGKVTFKDGTTITMESTRTRTLIEGYATETFQDDIYEIDGTSSGVNRKGVAFSTVSENLVKAFKCPYFKSGKTTYVSEKKTVVTTYTGGEECSPSASIEVNGKTRTITTEE